MKWLVLVSAMVVGACTLKDGGALFGDASDEIISEEVLANVTLVGAKSKSQCIQLVHQPDNPDSYAYAVNFHTTACKTKSDDAIDDAIAFSLRLDPPLDTTTSNSYVLVAEDLSDSTASEGWIGVGTIRVTVAKGKVRRAVIESLCSKMKTKDFAETCQLELSESGIISNIALRASGNGIGINNAVD